MKTTFTSESVCAGHPDKICDQISDAILDAALKQDLYSRVAVETLVTKDYVTLAGEVTTAGRIDYRQIARRVIRDLGYTNPRFQFTDHSPVVVKIHTQSQEIARGVDQLGAGDQGMMFGYACDETPELMPLPIILAHRLAEAVDRLKKTKRHLRPDGKTQVTISYANGRPKAAETVVLAVPHDEAVGLDQVKDELYRLVVVPVLAKYHMSCAPDRLTVNGTGVWHIGGPASDTGVTGRKIIVDTYGATARVGGGCFSGKDATKVDRSGAYAARYLAKNIVAAGLAKRAEVRLAYFIGARQPLMQEVETFGTETRPMRLIKDYMDRLLDTSVAGIINTLQLRRPLYLQTAAYGHFGKPGLPWEKISRLS
ncbi:methionine adenosyltransferase [Patescibacteria group bacterium]|nr:methionine adenosyltransferase [Patescibacteria group bacterium]